MKLLFLLSVVSCATAFRGLAGAHTTRRKIAVTAADGKSGDPRLKYSSSSSSTSSEGGSLNSSGDHTESSVDQKADNNDSDRNSGLSAGSHSEEGGNSPQNSYHDNKGDNDLGHKHNLPSHLWSIAGGMHRKQGGTNHGGKLNNNVQLGWPGAVGDKASHNQLDAGMHDVVSKLSFLRLTEDEIRGFTTGSISLSDLDEEAKAAILAAIERHTMSSAAKGSWTGHFVLCTSLVLLLSSHWL